MGSSDSFQIGDFVWGKIHSHLWWPGHVSDPLEASEQARNSEHLDHHVLVAYFGGSTVAWCEPSQLKHFHEEFQQMVERNSSQDYVAAVKDAIYEIERCLRSDMTCFCVPLEDVDQVRSCRKNVLGKASIANYSAVAFLEHLQGVAEDVSVANMLDITMLRSWAASFYLRNGCFVKMIEDLFDEKLPDLSPSPRNPCKDKSRQDFQATVTGVVKRPQISGEEPSRKKRSMAELIGLPDAEVTLNSAAEENKLGAMEDIPRGPIKPGILLTEKRKKGEKENDKVRNVQATKVVHEENGSTRRERRRSKYLSPPYTSGHSTSSNSFKVIDLELSENDSETSQHLYSNLPTYIGSHVASKNESDPLTTPSNYNEFSTLDVLREFLLLARNPLHVGRKLSAMAIKELFLRYRSLLYSGIEEFENLLEQHGDSDTSGNNLLHEMVTGSNKVTSRRKRNIEKHESNGLIELSTHQNWKKVKKDQAARGTTEDNCQNGVDVSKSGSRYRGKRGFEDAFSGNVEKFDQMVINSLDDVKIEQKRNKTRRAVDMMHSENEHLISSCDKTTSSNDDTNGDYMTDFGHTVHDSSGQSVSRSKNTKHVEDTSEISVALLLTFSSGSTLPSKKELLTVFSKYGVLIEHKTELFRDPGCARVVFARRRDAKKASSSIRKSNNFPFLVVDCQSFDLPRCNGNHSPSQSYPKASLVNIRQDLQKMIHTLSPEKGLTFPLTLKPEVRKDLINDIKALLNKVKKLMT